MTEHTFLQLLKRIITHGSIRRDRTGVGTRSLFGTELRFDLTHRQFPLLTTRRLPFRSIFEELMWILRGQTDVGILESKGIRVWTPNSTRTFLDQQGLHSYAPGDIGPSYGFQMRHFGAPYIHAKKSYIGQGFDQLHYVTQLLQTDPTSRRILIQLWNPADLVKMALPPCGYGYQFYSDGVHLSCKVSQRSSDISLAGGWNIASASLFTYMLGAMTRLAPKELIWSVGDCHIYENQLDVVMEQVSRTPREFPTLYLKSIPTNITSFTFKSLDLRGYRPHPKLSIAMNA